MPNRNIRKREQFKAFIKVLEKGTVCHWQTIADALDINKDTITEWKKEPEAANAEARGISRAIAMMEETGKKDWRMWQAKLKMFGIPFDFERPKIVEAPDYNPIVIYRPEPEPED